jgi:hypothetical protein
MAIRRPRALEDQDLSDDDIPLHRKQAFGAGLKRQKVEFVRAQDADVSSVTASAAAAKEKAAAAAIGDLYASVVLTEKKKKEEQTQDLDTKRCSSAPALSVEDEKALEPRVCDICGLPITSSVSEHNASLAHQVSIQHSHPPSHLDRSRMGLRTLASQGWDPDARIGLGREGLGMRFPIKVASKDDTLGIGAVIPSVEGKGENAGKQGEDGKKKDEKEKKTLSAKEMKALRKKEKERAERLQQEIYGRVDVERYLRGG